MHIGMGDTLPPCSSITVAPGFVGPVNCDPSSGGVNYPASQSQVASVEQALLDLQAQQDAMAQRPAGVSSSMLILVAAGLVALMVIKR
jgi:hypothetical protein